MSFKKKRRKSEEKLEEETGGGEGGRDKMHMSINIKLLLTDVPSPGVNLAAP